MNKFSLFLDESGETNLKTFQRSPYFIISGCIVQDDNRVTLKNYLDHIKYRYWQNKFEKVSLHSEAIGRHSGIFSSFVNSQRMASFAADIRRFFKNNRFEIVSVLIDKTKLQNTTWNTNTIYEKCFRQILDVYIKILVLRNVNGKVFAEASMFSQDVNLYTQFFHFQANGLPQFSITPKEVKSRVTSLSFVTKLNQDAEEELADLIGYGIKLNYLVNSKLKERAALNAYDLAILDGVASKLVNNQINYSDPQKKKIIKSLEALKIIP